MSELKFKEGGIKTLKKNLDEKESKIISLNEVVEKNDIVIAIVEANKKEVKSKWSKANTKMIGKSPLCGAKHILWDHLLAKITKFREYLSLVEEEHSLALSMLGTKYQNSTITSK